MQKIFSYILLAVPVYFSATSCQQAIRIDEDDYESKAVVFGRIGADSVAEIFLTQSIRNTGWVQESQQTQFIKNALVEVSNGSNADLLKAYSRYDVPYYSWRDDSVLVHFYEGAQIGETSKQYELSFEHNGKRIKGITTIPTPVDLREVKQTEITESDGFGTWTYSAIQTSIQDRAGEANAYRLHMEYKGWVTYPRFDPVTNTYIAEDSFYQTIRRSSQFELDEQRDGEEIQLIATPYFNVSYQMEELPDGRTMYFYDLVVFVETANIEFGRYILSLDEQRWNADDPLAEPVFLKSNIENGLGIFGGYSMSDTMHLRYVEYIE